MEQNGLDLASVREIFLPMHTSSQNAWACFCVFVGGEKLAREVFRAMSVLFCCSYIKGQNNIMRSSENLKYADMGYCYLTLVVYFPVLAG